MASFLFVFDFDDTLLPLNTDLLPVKQLAPDLLASHINSAHHRRAGWTALINTVLRLLHARDFSSDAILATVQSAPMPPPTKAMLNALFASPNVHCAIASDANSLYIDACLRANHVDPAAFDAGIFTNRAVILDDDSISVTPFVTDAHGCQSCPPNLCKSDVLTALQTRFPSSTVVYVGDGSNDYCPAKRVPANGYVLPRHAFRLQRLISHHGHVTAQVRAWSSAEQLQAIVQQILQPLTDLSR